MERQEDIREVSRVNPTKLRRRHAGYGERLPVNKNGLSHRVAGAVEALLPYSITDHRDGVSARAVIFVADQSPCRGWRPHGARVIPRYVRSYSEEGLIPDH